MATLDADKFSLVAESLKKYRRADLTNSDGKSILDKLYVDLMNDNTILRKCLLDNTTFLIGRKGTGKSTIFLKLENEYKKKSGYISCYVDVKTLYEGANSSYTKNENLSEYFSKEELERYLITRKFIQAVLDTIYKGIDEYSQNLVERVKDFFLNKKKIVKEELGELSNAVMNNEHLASVELPVLEERKITNANIHNDTRQSSINTGLDCEVSADYKSVQGKIKGGISNSNNKSLNTKQSSTEELSKIFLKVFGVEDIIKKIKEILSILNIRHLIIMLDDVSEIDDEDIKLFIDTIVAPLNNWSDEFIKFKVAFYSGKVHYGKIDPGKIDVINLDFYDLYAGFDRNRMEENAIDFTKRLLESRFQYYMGGENSIEDYFDDPMPEIYETFFKASMNVPRIIGYLLAFLHTNKVIYNNKIRKVDIEGAAVRYYNEKIEAFFDVSTIYCLLAMEERRDIYQLKKLRDILIDKAKEVKKQIAAGTLKGNVYDRKYPYTSHFHIYKDMEKYLASLELNHFITKYDEKKDRDGKDVSVYCFNYGLCKKNNILWGRTQGIESRKYFIERPFNYTKTILNQFKEIKIIKCSNCGQIFDESQTSALEMYGYKCPICGGKVCQEFSVDSEIQSNLERINKSNLLQISKADIKILLFLNTQTDFVYARDIASDVDINSKAVAKACKIMERDHNLVLRKTSSTPYLYKITDEGKKYFESKN